MAKNLPASLLTQIVALAWRVRHRNLLWDKYL
jgi:hypothetical protein